MITRAADDLSFSYGIQYQLAIKRHRWKGMQVAVARKNIEKKIQKRPAHGWVESNKIHGIKRLTHFN